MKYYIKLLRPKDWAKNLFLIVPSFFAGQFFVSSRVPHILEGFLAFCFFASGIYIINDYRDIEEDRKHPVKSKRPLASGKVKKPVALIICIVLLIFGSFMGYLADTHFLFLFILGLYFLINMSYSFGLKNFAILDILILSSGFVLRVKGGAVISKVDTSEWLIIMTFLLSLFMAIAKRRDDLLLKGTTGTDMRKSMSGYNLDFLNTLLGLSSAIIIVAYINYTVSPLTVMRLGTDRLYYSSLFVIAGLMRYLQITFVLKKSGSPTEILYKDHFIQVTLALWVFSIYVILYLRDVTIFKR
ncbi:MAG TPA: decaprenyl-phosphate phosphoribosyltransferase [Chitinophagaceae bacterium]|jgi:decaprenyl-phosphate phosphoribosyltransferase|nr:decaprenyl-phosphate phosphoribosyltransferase [Chitinophagaceae bacterium]